MFIEYIPFVIENTNVDFIIKKCVFIRIFGFFFLIRKVQALKVIDSLLKTRVSVTFPRVILEQVPTSLNCKGDHSLQQIESSHIFGDV